MSRRGRDWADAQIAGSLTLKAVLRLLGDLADDQGLMWHSQATLAARLECDVKTIRRALQTLEDRGLIRREERVRKDRSRSTDHVFLNIPQDADRTDQISPTPGLEARPVGTESPQGRDRKSPLTTFEPTLNPYPDSTDPCGSASPGEAGRDFRKDLLSRGVQAVLRLTGRPELRCRALIGSWLKLAGDDAVTVLRAIEGAVEAEAIEPVAWIEARLKRRPSAAAPIAAPAAVLADRSAEAARMVERGEWPIGGTVFVAADSPAGAAWERHFARFGRRARWTECGRNGLGWYMPAEMLPAPVPAA